jgi:hypothetical protein
MSAIPDWLSRQLNEACEMFGIGPEWHINIKMVDNPGGDSGNNGACRADAVYLNATLEFARDLEEGKTGRQVVFHEVGHIALAQISLVVEYGLSALLDDSQREIYQKMYRDAEEQFLQRFTRAMTREANATGNPQSA